MNVLYILDPATTGGATEAFLSFIRSLQKDHVNAIICSSADFPRKEELEGLPVRFITIGHCEMFTNRIKGHSFLSFKRRIKQKPRYVYHDLLALRTIIKNVRKEDIDIIHTNSSRSDVGFWLSMIWGKPHIVHLREFGDTDYEVLPLLPKWQFLYNHFSSRFICVSDAVRKHWENKGLDHNKMRVIYDGREEELIPISQDSLKKEECLKLVIAGVIIESKGQHLVIEALKYLSEKVRNNLTLDLFGGCDESYKEALLNNWTEQGLLMEKIHFHGNRNDMLQQYQHYDVGLMCSRSEGFGLVTAEYMFAQLGVIASDSGACPELITDKVEGLLFKSGSAIDLARAIEYYYNNRDIMIKNSHAARKKALMVFTVSNNVKEVCRQYEQVL